MLGHRHLPTDQETVRQGDGSDGALENNDLNTPQGGEALGK